MRRRLAALVLVVMTGCERSALILFVADAGGGAEIEGDAGAARRSAFALGLDHSCVLHQTGSISCWGGNASGQLGDGTTLGRSVAARVVGVSDAVFIAGAGHHVCAIRGSGQLVCWGANDQGQLGDGTTQQRTSPVEVVGLSDMRFVATSQWHSCGVRRSGEVLCWGRNAEGQLAGTSGDGALVAQVVQVGLPSLEAKVGEGWSCALTTARTVRCWGHLPGGSGVSPPVDVAGLNGTSSFDLGAHFGCAILDGGAASCWGENESEQLGAPNPIRRADAQPVDAGALTALSCGFAHVCALRPAGDVICWGDNGHQELGHVEAVARAPQGVPDLVGVTEIAAGGSHSCAWANAGAWCWGRNSNGELGDGTFDLSAQPRRVLGLP